MIRWVICPVDEEIDAKGRRHRAPRVARLHDRRTYSYPGGATVVNPPYRYSAAISSGLPGEVNDWCLCLVRFVDSTEMNADPQVISLLERDYNEETETLLDKTARQLAWNPARVRRVLDRLEARGIDVTGLTLDTPLWQVVERCGQHLHLHFRPGGTWVGRHET